MDEPTQTLERPVIMPAFTDEFTVIVLVAVAVPHKLVTVYMMVSIPAETPVTIPPEQWLWHLYYSIYRRLLYQLR